MGLVGRMDHRQGEESRYDLAPFSIAGPGEMWTKWPESAYAESLKIAIDAAQTAGWANRRAVCCEFTVYGRRLGPWLALSAIVQLLPVRPMRTCHDARRTREMLAHGWAYLDCVWLIVDVRTNSMLGERLHEFQVVGSIRLMLMQGRDGHCSLADLPAWWLYCSHCLAERLVNTYSY